MIDLRYGEMQSLAVFFGESVENSPIGGDLLQCLGC